MEVINYYVTTLSNSFKLFAPYIAFILGGYFVFVKMPFLFYRKSMDEQKLKVEEANKKEKETQKLEEAKVFKQQKKPDEKKAEEKKTENKKAPPKAPIKEKRDYSGFRPADMVSKETLKKRYFELLKENHPDRVATMGEEFKKLAEKNTKEINETYERLKKKAA